MNIGSIHHKTSNTGIASRDAQKLVPADKVASSKRGDRLAASVQSRAQQGPELPLQPVDRIPATRNNLDSQHSNDVEYPVYVQTVEQSSQRQQSSHRASQNERAIAFYTITETISSVPSQGVLIGVDTYA